MCYIVMYQVVLHPIELCCFVLHGHRPGHRSPWSTECNTIQFAQKTNVTHAIVLQAKVRRVMCIESECNTMSNEK
jgi:hypothetical protein